MLQFVLKTGSKLGVRMRTLSYAQTRQVFEEAIRSVGAEGSMFAARATEGEEGVRTALVAVTKKPVKDAADLLKLDASDWTVLTNEHLSQVGLEKYFSTKDVAVLVGAYRKLHDVTDKELDDILGEAQAVSEG